MTKITHHLSDSLLMAYCAGALPEAFNLIVASHISLCDECRAKLASFDAIGGAVMAQTETETGMKPDALAQTMARINSGALEPKQTPPRKTDDVLPAPLIDYVGGGVDSVKWRAVGGGVSQAILPTSSKASARLLRIPAGVAVPDHGHRGMELTLVLQGAFRDEYDHFARGDIEIADEDLHHMPVAEGHEDCICLAATDAPLKFNAILPRLAQPFLRI